MLLHHPEPFSENRERVFAMSTEKDRQFSLDYQRHIISREHSALLRSASREYRSGMPVQGVRKGLVSADRHSSERAGYVVLAAELIQN